MKEDNKLYTFIWNPIKYLRSKTFPNFVDVYERETAEFHATAVRLICPDHASVAYMATDN